MSALFDIASQIAPRKIRYPRPDGAGSGRAPDDRNGAARRTGPIRLCGRAPKIEGKVLP